MLVTLTTDFGTRDAYVAQLKAALYARGPASIEVIDLSHEIEPQNVREAALFVRAAWPLFPAGTIHMVVVDPGVGSARRALAVEHAGQRLFGPDNGVMSLVMPAVGGPTCAVAIDPQRLALTNVSTTFHGRDVFAPAVARAACGAPLREFGPLVTDWVQLALPAPRALLGGVRGEIIHVDRFGNLISNLPASLIGSPEQRRRARLHLDDGTLLPLVRCYADAPTASPVALIGSSDLIEVAVRDASAQAHTGARVGDALWIEDI